MAPTGLAADGEKNNLQNPRVCADRAPKPSRGEVRRLSSDGGLHRTDSAELRKGANANRPAMGRDNRARCRAEFLGRPLCHRSGIQLNWSSVRHLGPEETAD